MAESYKILGVAPSYLPGVSKVLRELSRVGISNFTPLENLNIAEANKYDVCIFGAWVPTYSVILPQITTHIWSLWTSPLLQMELGGVEWAFLHQILFNDKVEKVWFGDRGLESIFPEKGFHMPYPVSTESFMNLPEEKEKKDIGMLTALSNPQKNVMTQLAAVKLVQNNKPETLHVNGLPPIYKSFADRIGLSYIDHGFLPEDEYDRLLRGLKVQSHIFLSESFSYATMESVLLGTPCVVSPCVAENLGIDEVFQVNDVDDPTEIAGAIENILTVGEGTYRQFCDSQKKCALRVAEDNNYLIRVTLKKYL